MTKPFPHTAEAERLTALHDLGILDTMPEPEFDEIVHLATTICGTASGAISLIDRDRLWFKASVGLKIAETRRSMTFCEYTIRQKEILLVENALMDSRFADDPLVHSDAGLRFYAGVPVHAPNGQPLGALCVIDSTPRRLNREQAAALQVLAGQVTARLELRQRRRELEAALQEAEETKAALAARERQFATFMDSGPFLSYMKDADGRMVYYNQGMARQFDVDREFMLGKMDAELWPAELAETFRRNDLRVLETGTLQITLEESKNPDGSTRMYRSYKFPCRGGDGKMLVGGISLDVTEQLAREAALKRAQKELEQANERLSRLARIDGLTGLANRRVFDEQLKITFREARVSGQPLSLLMLDVDNFKQHNDRLGHTHGDEVLRQLGACLERQVRAGDLAARYGGEEFAVLMPGASTESALRLANRLLQSVRQLNVDEMPVTISIGLSTLQSYTRDTVHLLTQADEALYVAKHAGKDRVSAHQPIDAVTAARSAGGGGRSLGVTL